MQFVLVFLTQPNGRRNIVPKLQRTQNNTNYILKKSEQIVNGFIFLSCDDSLFASGNILEIGGYMPLYL
jgi:hypothetical protein